MHAVVVLVVLPAPCSILPQTACPFAPFGRVALATGNTDPLSDADGTPRLLLGTDDSDLNTVNEFSISIHFIFLFRSLTLMGLLFLLAPLVVVFMRCRAQLRRRVLFLFLFNLFFFFAP